MAKSKNHTNGNQNRKDHRNGIKKIKKWRTAKDMPNLSRNCCPKFVAHRNKVIALNKAIVSKN